MQTGRRSAARKRSIGCPDPTQGLWVGLYGTRVGVLNGLAFGDLLSTGRLVAATLFDSGGNPVPDFVLRSESGFDYLAAAAVPEPSAMLLLLAGLVAVLARQRFVRERRA